MLPLRLAFLIIITTVLFTNSGAQEAESYDLGKIGLASQIRGTCKVDAHGWLLAIVCDSSIRYHNGYFEEEHGITRPGRGDIYVVDINSLTKHIFERSDIIFIGQTDSS